MRTVVGKVVRRLGLDRHVVRGGLEDDSRRPGWVESHGVFSACVVTPQQTCVVKSIDTLLLLIDGGGLACWRNRKSLPTDFI